MARNGVWTIVITVQLRHDVRFKAGIEVETIFGNVVYLIILATKKVHERFKAGIEVETIFGNVVYLIILATKKVHLCNSSSTDFGTDHSLPFCMLPNLKG